MAQRPSVPTKFRFLPLGLALALLGACQHHASETDLTPDQLKQVLLDHPEVLRDVLKAHPDVMHQAIEADPVAFMETLQTAARSAEAQAQQQARLEEQRAREQAFENPLQPLIRDDELIMGTPGAPYTLVKYSDFECPFCLRGYNTVNQLMERHPGQIQFILKHLPLDFHAQAMPAARYFEALRLQNPEMAVAFYDGVFAGFSRISEGKPFFDELALQAGADLQQLAEDLDSDTVTERIASDQAEARSFGINGTPGFVFNGIPVRGALPLSHFENLMQALRERGLVDAAGS